MQCDSKKQMRSTSGQIKKNIGGQRWLVVIRLKNAPPPFVVTFDPEGTYSPLLNSHRLKLLPYWSYATKKSVGTKRWYIGFYLNDNGDGTFRVDHLMRAGTGDEIWQRPHGTDDIQDTIEQQIVPVTWNISSRKPHFVLSNAIEVEDIFCKIC